MNYVPGALFYLEPSMVSHSGTPIYVMIFFYAIPVSNFLAMGYISAKKIPLEKT